MEEDVNFYSSREAEFLAETIECMKNYNEEGFKTAW